MISLKGQIETRDGIIILLVDTCEDMDSDGVYDTLIEYECIGEFDYVTSTLNEDYIKHEITCSCKDGVCTNVVPGVCIDTDGNDKYMKGLIKGELTEGGRVTDYDYCMNKIGQSYEETDRCSGPTCFVNEYNCNFKSQVTKYVHECSLGCVDGMCVGKECARTEEFVINNAAILSYDASCELEIDIAQYKYDLPSSSFNNMKDFNCCSGSSEAYCVYKGKCYPSSRNSNYYTFNNETVVCGCSDPTCNFEDGNHEGVWFDMDSSQALCEGQSSETDACNIKWYSETEFKWIRPGIDRDEVESTWEYESYDFECCGDDSSEFVICSDGDCLCCDAPSSVIVNGKCSLGTSETNNQNSNTKNSNDLNDLNNLNNDDQNNEGGLFKDKNVDSSKNGSTTSSFQKSGLTIMIVLILLLVVGIIVFIVLFKDKLFKGTENASEEKHPDEEITDEEIAEGDLAHNDQEKGSLNVENGAIDGKNLNDNMKNNKPKSKKAKKKFFEDEDPDDFDFNEEEDLGDEK